jgi:hypothetical protein
VRSDFLPALLTPGQRRDVTMWRCNSWVHLICIMTLFGNLALTAATTGEYEHIATAVLCLFLWGVLKLSILLRSFHFCEINCMNSNEMK